MSTISIADLVRPQLTPVQREVLAHTEARHADITVTELIRRATDSTGLVDFDADDGFHRRLEAHVAAINGDTGMTQLNRRALRDRVQRLLVHRLRLTELLRRHPEIHDIELAPPIIVVGLPRSGTTHLVNLIATDPGRRALPYWESQEPFPGVGNGPGVDGLDPRYVRAAQEHQLIVENAPVTAAMHDRFPEAIEEEVEILDLDFASYTLEWHARVPDWRDFYLGLDHDQHYEYLRTVLKALTFLRGPASWVLKSPQHCEQLGALHRTFPDAVVAFTHRDPVAVIQSAATMMAYSDRMRRTSIDPEWLIEYWTDRVERLLRACVRDRHVFTPERSVDVGFHTLNDGVVEVIADLYRRGGIHLAGASVQVFTDYLAANPRGKHGRIDYDLSGHFGVTADEIRARFDFYFDRFDVREETIV